MKNIFLLLIIALAVCACGAQTNKVVPERLFHRTYVLDKVDGVCFVSDTKPALTFFDDMRLFGYVCNNFVGGFELKGDVLTATALASTRKMCFDDRLHALEVDLMRLLSAGMEVALHEETLILRRGDRSFTFRLSGQ